jgi:hypothetical protein
MKRFKNIEALRIRNFYSKRYKISPKKMIEFIDKYINIRGRTCDQCPLRTEKTGNYYTNCQTLVNYVISLCTNFYFKNDTCGRNLDSAKTILMMITTNREIKI